MFVNVHKLNGFENLSSVTSHFNMKTSRSFFLVFFILLLTSFASLGQTIPFQDEVKSITARIEKEGWKTNSVLFTGSSSVRLWENLQEKFPETPIINTGFGGSQASDLLVHLDALVIQYQPKKVFIYEGDNDLNEGKEVSLIMNDLDILVNRIHQKLPDTNIVLISAKPSPSRWKLKTSYMVLNDLMRQYATTHEKVNFMNVWNAMLDQNGKPISEIFIADSLHMNEKGYAIWNKSVIPFLK